MPRVLSTCVGWALLVLLCSVLPSLGEPVGAAPDVIIAQGVVKGVETTSLRGRSFYSYRGIHYAKAPVGDLRFRAPVPVEPSSDVIDATKDGPMCMQKLAVLGSPAIMGQEDCLVINVYTPQTGALNLPVMVFIHGGGFYSGTAASYSYGPNYLLDKDIVLVTFNYRLGALGFLSSGDSEAPGNYGLKDQVAALKWVRDNIAAFGGDPGSVTLFGESAGSASVHLHMLSNQSEGLFHRAISQSGAAISYWAWPPLNPYLIAEKQASYLGCPTDESQQMIDCLRQVDALNIAASIDIFHVWDVDPMVTYGPVVEDPLNPTSFLTAHPLDLLGAGRINKVPWILGNVGQEGIYRAQPIIANKTLLDDLNANWNTLGPWLLELGKSIENPKVITDMWKNITSFYFNDELPVTEENGIHLVDLYSDRWFVHSTHKAALLHAAQGHDSIYLYNIDYRGRYSYADLLGESNLNYGIGHADDLIYLFSALGLFPEWPENDPDLKMVDSMVTLWTNFAIYGTPTPPGDSPSTHVTCDLASTETYNRCDLSRLSWTTVPRSRTSYLNIYASNNETLDFAMEEDFYRDRMAFWDQAPLMENLS